MGDMMTSDMTKVDALMLFSHVGCPLPGHASGQMQSALCTDAAPGVLLPPATSCAHRGPPPVNWLLANEPCGPKGPSSHPLHDIEADG
eukprot:1346367-Lingulodinium_polyedra.AAC.1